MKYIAKQGAPIDYSLWCNNVKGTDDEDYRRMQNPPKGGLKEALLREQGYLCAYTMRRIKVASAHIEHIKPESLCRIDEAGSDLDYRNMVACYPRDGLKAGNHYGAPVKGDWWEDEGGLFVSPLHPICESRFEFSFKGEISAVSNNAAALETIRILKLDHISLTEDRAKAIESYIFGDNNEPLSQKKIEAAMKRICDEKNNAGEFLPFCVAIRSALQKQLIVYKKQARDRKFAKSKKK